MVDDYGDDLYDDGYDEDDEVIADNTQGYKDNIDYLEEIIENKNKWLGGLVVFLFLILSTTFNDSYLKFNDLEGQDDWIYLVNESWWGLSKDEWRIQHRGGQWYYFVREKDKGSYKGWNELHHSSVY